MANQHPFGAGLPSPIDFPPTSAMIAADPLPKRGRTPACSPSAATTRYVTYALVVLNVLVFLIELSGGDQFRLGFRFSNALRVILSRTHNRTSINGALLARFFSYDYGVNVASPWALVSGCRAINAAHGLRAFLTSRIESFRRGGYTA